MKVLAVDSSSITASVAVLEEKKILAEFYINAGLTHSQTLAPMIDAVIKSLGLHLRDIDLFAVTQGPGSFTGLRIGMATVKGMAIGVGKKCVGVSSLLAAAYASRAQGGIVVPCMDARRGEVYCAAFKSDKKNLTRIFEDSAISIDELGKILETYNQEIKLVGDGAEMCYNTLGQNYNLRVELMPDCQRYIRASMVGLAALESLGENQIVSAEEIKPKYLRVSQAERLLSTE